MNDQAFTDYVANGEAGGSVAARLLQANFDMNIFRPFIGNDGNSYVTRMVNGQPKVFRTNTAATLLKDEWIMLDKVIIKAAQSRLRCWDALREHNGEFVIPNGMAKTVLQYQTQSDVSGARTSMDGLAAGENDRVINDLGSLPLPIIHKPFGFSARELATSRNGGSPLDTTMADLCARKVAEEVEKYAIGSNSAYYFGGGYIYGFTNFPSRNTKTLTSPASGGWAPTTTVTEILDMRKKLKDDKMYGPYDLYFSLGWEPYLDRDYVSSGGNNPNQTLRERIAKIDGIQSIETLDYLSNYDVVMVQRTPDVARAVVGMDFTTLQWQEKGGLEIMFQVMCIMVPQLRADYNGNCGICHGSV